MIGRIACLALASASILLAGCGGKVAIDPPTTIGNGGGSTTSSTTTSTTTTTTTTTSTTTTTTTVIGVCGGSVFSSDPACEACIESQCCAELAACPPSTQCGQLLACEHGCPLLDDACFGQCQAKFPAGVAQLQTVIQCTTSCASNGCTDQICGTGLSTAVPICDDCLAANCCDSLTSCINDMTCFDCLTVDPNAPTCQMSGELQQVLSCFSSNCSIACQQ